MRREFTAIMNVMTQVLVSRRNNSRTYVVVLAAEKYVCFAKLFYVING